MLAGRPPVLTFWTIGEGDDIHDEARTAREMGGLLKIAKAELQGQI